MSTRPLWPTCSAAALLALGMTALLPAAHATAQQQPAARMRFEAMDANHDGRITRDEWRGSDRSFANHDWNGDGVLSGDEVRIGAQRTSDWGTADHRPSRYEQEISWNEQGFHDLDHNRDGRLTANEWHFDLETFRRIDRNHDNAISTSEFLGNDLDDDRDDRFDDLDVNNDGRVTRDEWHAGLDEFRRLDRNRDGVLSRYEVVGQQGSFDTYDEFQSLDYNRNGTIEPNEWHWSRPSFAELDANGDGVISRRELEEAGVTSNPGQAPESREIRVDAARRWTDTGVSVRAGEVVTISASGEIQMSDDAGDTATPAGSRRGRTAPDAPVLRQLAGGLIAKIDDYPPMFIGNRTTVTAPVTGRIYLGVNDDYLDDNRGAFSVTLGVRTRTSR